MAIPPNVPQDIEGKPEGKVSDPSVLIFLNVTNTITHFVLGAVAFSAIFFANIYMHTTSLKQHIYLCVIGYVILMSQAVLSLNPSTSWARSMKYQEKRTIHWIMQILGSILAICGSIIRITDINTHFRSAHGVLGLIAMILTILSLIGGFVNLCSSKIRSNPVVIKVLHSCFGTLTLCCAYFCLCFGFHDYYRFTLGDINANLSIALTVFALIGTIMSACNNMFKRMLC